jgi:hypothetical protein
MFTFTNANRNGSIQIVAFGGIELGKIMTVPLPTKTPSFTLPKIGNRNAKVKMGWRIIPNDRLNLRSLHRIYPFAHEAATVMKNCLAPKTVAPPVELAVL